MAVSERDKAYFDRIGAWKASLPPVSSAPPRTFDQVYELLLVMRRGLTQMPMQGDDDIAVERLTEFRERLLCGDAEQQRRRATRKGGDD